MALQRPIWFMPYQTTPAGPISPVKITNSGASTPITSEDNTYCSFTPTYAKIAFVHRGKPYFPTDQGWFTYNWRSGYIEKINAGSYTLMQASIGKYVAVYSSAERYRCDSPESIGDASTYGGSLGTQMYDYIVHNGDLYLTPVASATYNNLVWAYPFTSSPANAGILQINRFAIHGNELYGIQLSTGTSYLCKFSGGTWSTVGTGFALTDAANISTPTSYRGSCCSLFSFGGSLWLVVGYTGSGGSSWRYRAFTLATDGNSATENTTVIPAAMQSAPGAGVYRLVWEVLDDAGSSRQVFLGLYGVSSIFLDLYELVSDSQAMTLIAATGSRCQTNGIMWDLTAKSCDVVDGSDNPTLAYASIDHWVSHRDGNSTVDVDIRHKKCIDVSASPPWTACTNKSGYGEGKTSLASKPSGILVASDLDEDFSGSEADPDLWEWVNNYVDWSTGGDRGSIPLGSHQWHKLVYSGGALCLDGPSPSPVYDTYNGIGLRSKWGVGGAFEIDATIRLTNLRAGVAGQYALVFMAKSGFNKGYGFRIWINSSGTVNSIEGFSLSSNSNAALSATTTGYADGVTLRIERDVSANWTLTLDPDGLDIGPVDLTPGTAPNHGEDVLVYLGLQYSGSTNGATADPGPGFTGIQFSGDLGQYQDVVEHEFAWDHLTDLGADVNTTVALFGDTN